MSSSVIITASVFQIFRYRVEKQTDKQTNKRCWMTPVSNVCPLGVSVLSFCRLTELTAGTKILFHLSHERRSVPEQANEDNQK